MSSSEQTGVIEIPYATLAAETLRALVEEVVTRSGTDYGAEEAPLERKIADVMRQLERGEARVVFDTATATANIVPAG